MEYKNVYISIIVVILCAFAFITWTGSMDTAYNTNISQSFNTTFGYTNALSQVTDIGYEAANNSQNTGGSGSSDAISDLVKRGTSTISTIGALLGIGPSLVNDAAILMDVPQIYITLARIAFYFVFALTLAYLFILGARAL